MTRKPVDLKASVAARLRNIASRKQVSLDMIFRRYAIERLLYRLSLSPWRERFVLKGAMLFTVWLPDAHRLPAARGPADRSGRVGRRGGGNRRLCAATNRGGAYGNDLQINMEAGWPVEGTSPSTPEADLTGSGDDLGDRMKGYEAAETERTFDRLLPIYARIDGRSFARLTRSMQRPFDARMTAAMIATTAHLIRETHARIGYTQSDEISLAWLVDAESEPLFGGKVHKWTSVLASLAAAAFQQELARAFGTEAEKLAAMLPHFDARVLQLPSKIEAANAILWRTLDARKNAVSMAARAAFSAKALNGKDQAEMRAMMAAKGIDFDAYPQSVEPQP